MYKRKLLAPLGPRKKTSASDAFPRSIQYRFSGSVPAISTHCTRRSGGGSRKHTSSSANHTNPAAAVGTQTEQVNPLDQQQCVDSSTDHVDDGDAAHQPPAVSSAAYYTTKTCSSSRPQTQNEADESRYRAMEKNWDNFDHAAPDLLLNTLSGSQQMWQLTASISQKQIQDAACQGECDKCGCSTTDCEALRQVPVAVFDQLACYTVHVNVYQCNRCAACTGEYWHNHGLSGRRRKLQCCATCTALVSSDASFTIVTLKR